MKFSLWFAAMSYGLSGVLSFTCKSHPSNPLSTFPYKTDHNVGVSSYLDSITGTAPPSSGSSTNPSNNYPNESYATVSSALEESPPIPFSHAQISHFDISKLTPKGPRKGADIGSPHDSTRPLTSIGSVKTGSWWCAEGGWPSPNLRATTEIFYVLSGRACVTDLDGTRNFFGPGDLVILPKGWSGRWDILQDIHKVWVVTDHPDTMTSTKAVVKPYSNFSPHFLTSNGVRSDATHGSPITASDTYYDNGYVSVGSWTCTPGSFPVHERTTTEAFHLLEGVCFITNSDGSAQRCVAGDTVVLPRGWSGYWDIIEPVKKVWVVSTL